MNFDSSSFKLISDFMEAMQRIGLEGSLFNIRWYNEFRWNSSPGRPQLIDSENPDALGIVFLSTGDFFQEVIRSFDSEDPNPNFVDKTVDSILAKALKRMPQEYGAVGWNTDKPPYFHVQSIGHVSAVDEYVPASSLQSIPENMVTKRDQALWGSLSDKVLGVSIHPKYGGWYAYRMMVVFHGVTWDPSVPRPEPLHFLTDDDKQNIVHEYNTDPDLGRWRDLNDRRFKLKRYDVAQYLYFHERSLEKRRRILQLLQDSYFKPENGLL